MADSRHVAVVLQGRDAIAKWRKSHRGVPLDLSGADLAGAHLEQADLAYANLTKTNLSKAKLAKANLRYADLFVADLSGADLTEADLAFASLISTTLTAATLRAADLSLADLTLTDLTRADLMYARLFLTKMYSTVLLGADLAESLFDKTCLLDVDLNEPEGLTMARHSSRSQLSMETLTKTLRKSRGRFTKKVTAFAVNAGVSLEMLAALPAILAEAKYHSCFICYGQPDLKFAQRLTKTLRGKSVSCWLYDLDATPGERTWGEIKKKRQEAGKMVVLCSNAALIRDGTLKEIEEQIDEEPGKLVPISLDDIWKQPGFRVMRGSRDLKPYLLERNYADFANPDYARALERLLGGLTLRAKRKRKKG